MRLGGTDSLTILGAARENEYAQQKPANAATHGPTVVDVSCNPN
jgi:hypothetical protein